MIIVCAYHYLIQTKSYDMDMDIERIIESVYEMNNNALKNYGILISTFALVLGCSIVDLDTTMIIIIDITVIRRDEWTDVELTTKTHTQRAIGDLGPTYYHLKRFTRDELKTLYNLFIGKLPEKKLHILSF